MSAPAIYWAKRATLITGLCSDKIAIDKPVARTPQYEMNDKAKRLIARIFLVLGSAIVPAVGLISETTHSAPPRATLAIRRGTLVYVTVKESHQSRGKSSLSLHVTDDDNQEFSVAVDFPEFFTRLSDLAPKTPITLYTAESYWFDRATHAPDVWQIDTDAGTVLSYAQSLAAWEDRRKRAIDVFSVFAGVPLVLCCCLDWFERRSGRDD
jgi:hypothetical protein